MVTNENLTLAIGFRKHGNFLVHAANLCLGEPEKNNRKYTTVLLFCVDYTSENASKNYLEIALVKGF